MIFDSHTRDVQVSYNMINCYRLISLLHNCIFITNTDVMKQNKWGQAKCDGQWSQTVLDSERSEERTIIQ